MAPHVNERVGGANSGLERAVRVGYPLHGRTRVDLVRELRSSFTTCAGPASVRAVVVAPGIAALYFMVLSYRRGVLRIGGAKAGPVEIVCILLTFGYMGFLVWTAAKRNGLA